MLEKSLSQVNIAFKTLLILYAIKIYEEGLFTKMVKNKIQEQLLLLNLFLISRAENSLLAIFTEQVEYNVFIQLPSPTPT